MDKKPRIFGMSFASVYVLYVQKAEKKGRTRAEVDEVIAWLTGYEGAQLQRALDTKIDFETFFAKAPKLNPNVGADHGRGVRRQSRRRGRSADAEDSLPRQARR